MRWFLGNCLWACNEDEHSAVKYLMDSMKEENLIETHGIAIVLNKYNMPVTIFHLEHSEPTISEPHLSLMH